MIAVYDEAGRILRVVTVPLHDADSQLSGAEQWVEIAPATNDATHYVSSGTVTAKSPLTATWDKTTITADDVDVAVLSPLPIPCTVYIDGAASVINDGSLEFAAAVPGMYNIRIDEVAYLAQAWEITAE